MKISKIIALMKSSNGISIINMEDGTQWISDGYAVFPLYGLPKFENSDEFCACFDITGPKRQKIHFKFYSLYPEICFEDRAENEAQIMPYDFNLGNDLLALKTPSGIGFIQRKYIRPLEANDNEIEYYERFNREKNSRYFVVKVGLMIQAIIMPYKVVTAQFVDKISDIAAQCELSLDNWGGDEI